MTTPIPQSAEFVRATEPDLAAAAAASVVGARRELPTRLGKYEILCRLAIGGMAEIFLARNRGAHGFEKRVVVKRILPHYAADPNFVQMFLDEARLAARLQHPNIGQVYDIGQDDETYFFAMEYLRGADLSAIWRAAEARGERIPLEHALAIVADVAAGLHYAHERVDSDGTPLNLVHRDVSPSNILVTYDGVVKLVDFGIARAKTRTHETHTGMLRGKLAYMSPEQCRREKLDRRADIFALGIVLYELTTGQRLFRHGDESDYLVMTRIVHGDVPPPTAVTPGYPAALEAIAMRALATDRDARHPTAGALMSELRAFMRAEGIATAPAALAGYVEALTDDRPDQWATASDLTDNEAVLQASIVRDPTDHDPTDHGIAPDDTIDTGDTTESNDTTEHARTDHDIATATATARADRTDHDVTAVLRRPPRPAPPTVEQPTLPSVTLPRVRLPTPRPERRRPDPKLAAVAAAAVALAVALAIGTSGGDDPTTTPAPEPATATEPARAEPIAEPIDEPPIDEPVVEAPEAAAPEPAPAPAPTVTALANDGGDEPDAEARPRRKARAPERSRRAKRKRARKSKRARARPRRAARTAKPPKPEPKPEPSPPPNPEPDKDRAWNPDSPLLPSRSR